MHELDRLMHIVRELVADILGAASDALDRGVPIDRIHGYYVRVAEEILADAEMQALLARQGSGEALEAVESSVRRLASLGAELLGEARQDAGDEG